MVANLDGILECINDDFKYLCDSKYLEIINLPPKSLFLLNHKPGENLIYHTKYKFIFNHESPGHANLYKDQRWKNGINHFVMNDYEELKNRYNRRINDMKELINSGKFINFLLTRPDTTDEDLKKITETINEKYPNLKFKIVLFEFNKKMYDDYMLFLKNRS